MFEYLHGADIYGNKVKLDFSSNLNPLGMPKRVKEALESHVGSYDVYPDFECRKLKEKLSEAIGVDKSWILCTAGASDLMLRICLAIKPAKALVTSPCFSGYLKSLQISESQIVESYLDEREGFVVGGDFVKKIRDVDIAFLCNPNNPTGVLVPKSTLDEVLEQSKTYGTIIVMDECFLAFTDAESMVEKCRDYPNLIVMRAFTKTFSMAGLRLGYGVCSDTELLDKIFTCGSEWSVSTPAQIAGLAALDTCGFIEKSRNCVAQAREKLFKNLVSFGLRVIEGKANFLLFHSEVDLYTPLLKRGILIRDCSNYRGLNKGWYRVAVKTQEENDVLISALSEILRS